VQPDAFVTVDLTDSGKLSLNLLFLHRARELTRRSTDTVGKVLEALLEVDLKYKLDPKGTNQIGIVHLAALPTPGQAVNSVMFQTNVMAVSKHLPCSL